MKVVIILFSFVSLPCNSKWPHDTGKWAWWWFPEMIRGKKKIKTQIKREESFSAYLFLPVRNTCDDTMPGAVAANLQPWIWKKKKKIREISWSPDTGRLSPKMNCLLSDILLCDNWMSLSHQPMLVWFFVTGEWKDSNWCSSFSSGRWGQVPTLQMGFCNCDHNATKRAHGLNVPNHLWSLLRLLNFSAGTKL